MVKVGHFASFISGCWHLKRGKLTSPGKNISYFYFQPSTMISKRLVGYSYISYILTQCIDNHFVFRTDTFSCSKITCTYTFCSLVCIWTISTNTTQCICNKQAIVKRLVSVFRGLFEAIQIVSIQNIDIYHTGREQRFCPLFKFKRCKIF